MTPACWADDTWLIAKSAAESNWMISEAWRSTWASIQQNGRDMQDAASPECSNLGRMTELPAGQCLRVLGAYVQTDGAHDQEYKEVVRVAWAAYHARQTLWRTPGRIVQKLRVLQMTVCRHQGIGQSPNSVVCARSRRA